MAIEKSGGREGGGGGGQMRLGKKEVQRGDKEQEMLVFVRVRGGFLFWYHSRSLFHSVCFNSLYLVNDY